MHLNINAFVKITTLFCWEKNDYYQHSPLH